MYQPYNVLPTPKCSNCKFNGEDKRWYPCDDTVVKKNNGGKDCDVYEYADPED